MERTVIKLCYRKIIDSSAQKPWDKFVLEDSYTEFLLQSQMYNTERKYSGFNELITNVPNADKLHFLAGTAITGYIKQLNGTVPDIVNSMGRLFLPFKNFRFEIINSDIKNKALHKVAVNFYSEPLVWHATIGNQLLVSVENTTADNNGEILTETFSLQPFTGVYSIRQIT